MGKRKRRLAADSVGFATLSTSEAASSLEKRLSGRGLPSVLVAGGLFADEQSSRP
jgi:hypothetical protein